jgi:hypothetical protein
VGVGRTGMIRDGKKSHCILPKCPGCSGNNDRCARAEHYQSDPERKYCDQRASSTHFSGALHHNIDPDNWKKFDQWTALLSGRCSGPTAAFDGWLDTIANVAKRLRFITFMLRSTWLTQEVTARLPAALDRR